MNLPSLNVPVDNIKLYSLPKPVTVRPYLVGEEKILLMAQQAQEQDPNTKEVEKAVRQIIERCTMGVISMDTLPVFDVGYLFLKLRAMSLNNIIETQFRCKNLVQKQALPVLAEACNTLVPISININDIKLTVPAGHTNKIMLSDTLGITLKYPTAPVYDMAQKAADLADVITSCLETVFVADQVWEIANESPKDIERFVNDLTLAHVETIRTKFFDTMPRLTHTFTFTCPTCGYSENVVLQELEDFFD